MTFFCLKHVPCSTCVELIRYSAPLLALSSVSFTSSKGKQRERGTDESALLADKMGGWGPLFGRYCTNIIHTYTSHTVMYMYWIYL